MKESIDIDYERDIEINPEELDVEWLEQPRLMIRYAQIASKAKKEMDMAKERLETVRAELDRDIRSDPGRYALTKITESVVQSTVISQSEYKEAMQDYIDAQYEFNMTKYAVQAMEQRKKALENLVILHGQQYFAGPRVPRDLSKEWENKQKQKQSNGKVRIKRTNT